MRRRHSPPGRRPKVKPGKPTPRSCWSCYRSRIVGGLLECVEGQQGVPEAAARCREFTPDPGPQVQAQEGAL